MEHRGHHDGYNHRYQAAVEEKGFYVVSEDIVGLLKQWATPRGFTLPSDRFFTSLRDAMKQKLEEFFPRVMLIREQGIRKMFRDALRDVPRNSILSTDHVYAPRGCLHLEVTRLTGEDMKSQGQGSRNAISIAAQLESLSRVAREPITLVDDVLFSGKSACELIGMVHESRMVIERIFAGISTHSAVEKIHRDYPEIEIFSGLYFPNPIKDEVCERDFYAGVPFSGRSVGHNGVVLAPERGIPYFQPFADRAHVEEWSSVPEEHAEEWSHFCCVQSIMLWDAIEKCSKKKVRCSDLSRRPHPVPCDDSSFVDRLHEYALVEA